MSTIHRQCTGPLTGPFGVSRRSINAQQSPKACQAGKAVQTGPARQADRYRPPPRKRASRTRPRPRTFVLFGGDEFGKPRAAKSAADDKELLAEGRRGPAPAARRSYYDARHGRPRGEAPPTGRLHAEVAAGWCPISRTPCTATLVRRRTYGRSTPCTARPAPTASRRAGQLGRDRRQGHLVIAKESQECGCGRKRRSLSWNGDLVGLQYPATYPYWLWPIVQAPVGRRADQPRRKVTRPASGQTQPPLTGASPDHASLAARRARRFAPVVPPHNPNSWRNDMDQLSASERSTVSCGSTQPQTLPS